MFLVVPGVLEMDLRRVEKTQQCLEFDWCNPRDIDGKFISGTFQLLLFAQFHELWRTHSKGIRKGAGFGTEVVFVDAVQYPVYLVLRDMQHQNIRAHII